MRAIGILSLFALFFIGGCNRQEAGLDTDNVSFEISSPFGTHYITDYEISFQATDKDGQDITSSVIFYVDSAAIDGHTYIFTRPGNHIIYAEWDLGGIIKTSDNRIRAEVDTPRHATYVLVEDFTGTWCVNCPRVQYKLDRLMERYDRVYALAVHNGAHQNDPFHFEGVDELAQVYGITAYPTPLLNRREVWDEEPESVENFLLQSVPAGIQIISHIDGSTLTWEVNVRFDTDLQDDTYRLAIYASENGLHADQANATPYYGGQNPIPDFEHNHVLRHAFTNVLGDPIPSESCKYDNIYRRTYTGPLPAEISDPSHAEFTAILLKGNERPVVINVKQAPVNTDSGY